MAVLSVLRLPKECYDYVGSCLRTESSDIQVSEFGTLWLRNLIADMFETLYSFPSGVGLSANQVGILKKICVIDIKRDGKKPMVLLNPMYEPISNEIVESKEVCLSFPLVASTVNRYKKVQITFQDYLGFKHIEVIEGFKSFACQHEIDHLNGLVHVDLCKDTSGQTDYLGYSLKMANTAVDNYTSRLEKRNEK